LTGVTTLSHAEFDGETVLYSVLQSTCSSYTDFYEPTFGDMSVYRRLSLPWRVPTHWDQIFCNDDCPRQRQTHRILNLLFPEQDSELVEQCCEQGLCQLHRPTKVIRAAELPKPVLCTFVKVVEVLQNGGSDRNDDMVVGRLRS
jgi:hypothetical protein